MTKVRLVVLLAFLLVFGAGVGVGMCRTHWGPRRPDFGSMLEHELGLTRQQSERMREIWSTTISNARREQDERRQAARQTRDEKVRALLGPDRADQYDQVVKEYDAAMHEIDRSWHEVIQSAIEQTKQLLSPEQREKYQQMLQRWEREWKPGEHRGSRGPGPASRAGPSREE